MLRITTCIVERQRAYLEHGVRYLQPLSRARIAEQLGLHESTVSRATAGKFVMLPNSEVIPYSHFFTPSLSVKDVMKELIEKEGKPLTDNDILDRLKAGGIHIARRTVAKYRQQLDILPSALRKRCAASAISRSGCGNVHDMQWSGWLACTRATRPRLGSRRFPGAENISIAVDCRAIAHPRAGPGGMWLTIDGLLWHQVPSLNRPGASDMRTVCGLGVRRVSIVVYASNAGCRQVGCLCSTCSQLSAYLTNVADSGVS